MAYVSAIDGLDEESQLEVLRGERLDRAPKPVVTKMTRGALYDVLGVPLGILFVAEPLKDVLARAPGANIQLFPTKIAAKPKLGFFMVNVLDAVPFIDLEKSTYETFAGTDAISNLRKIRMRAVPEHAPPIFHAAEERTLIVVSDELRRALQAASDTPGILIPAEKFPRKH